MMNSLKTLFLFELLLIWMVGPLSPALGVGESGPTPPAQPDSGPGGREYPHQDVRKSVYGEGDLEYWLFEPADPVPRSSPVVIFLHGWSGMNPAHYGGWIDHLARRGNIVIFPRYQASLRTPVKDFTPHAVQALQSAFAELKKSDHVQPELDKVAVVGHSMGGELTPNVAALAKESGLPVPKALMTVEPGKTWTLSEMIRVHLEDLTKIDPSTLLLAVAGEDDNIARDIDAKKIFKGTPQIPPANKNYIVVRSDDHGKPPLKASHFSPASIDQAYDSGEKPSSMRSGGGEGPDSPPKGKLREKLKERIKNRMAEQGSKEYGEMPDLTSEDLARFSINALDFYGYWKLFDGLTDAAFYGKNREFAFGNTPQQRFMGTWSDGVPVKELKVMTGPFK